MLPTLKRAQRLANIAVATQGEEIVGFIHVYDRKDCIRKIHQLAVREPYRRNGIASMLLRWATTSAPKDTLKISLKCPEDAEANSFYLTSGLEAVAFEEGKRRRLVVWELGLESNAK